MEIRRFSPDLKTKVPGGHSRLYGVPIHLDRAQLPTADLDALAERLNGLPIILDRELLVTALYFEPQARMDEHSAEQPILFLVIGGRGVVRVGGPDGETRLVAAGDAVLWPAGVDHAVWTDDDALQAIVIEGPAERTAAE
jgi:quercetin dioxygenase-like cupin family protein